MRRTDAPRTAPRKGLSLRQEPKGFGASMSEFDAIRLQLSVAAALQAIATVRAEREAPATHAARRHLGEIHGVTRLRKRLERERRAG